MEFRLYFVVAVALFFVHLARKTDCRSFVIDYENDQFLKDGEPFRYISGSMHYFRIPRIYWADRFKRLVAAGLNAVQTYIDWSQHEPYPGVYNFDENLDLIEYFKLAQSFGLVVILRPGPYIDAERDMGGLPFWLLQKKQNIQLRTKDPTYIKYVDLWFGKILPLIEPLLYSNGGPIISVQVENEYGSYFACDFDYTSHLRDLFRNYLGNDVILFTTDGAGDSYIKCGKIEDTFTTVDFGPGSDVASAFKALRNHQPRGPLVNSEYYTGWLDHWAYPHANPAMSSIISTLNDILAMNASVNLYMFHGGTNFGFTNGGNIDSGFVAVPTSYDYNAPLSEAGDTTDKYYAIRALIQKYTKKKPAPVPKPVPKFAYGTVDMKFLGSLFNFVSKNNTISSIYPLTFEQLGQAYGFVLYETIIPDQFMDPTLLSIPGLHDRAIIFVDQKTVGILSRQDSIYSLPVTVFEGQLLSIFVENMGRVCFGTELADYKGLTSNVTLAGKILTNWKITQLPLNNTKEFISAIKYQVATEKNNGELDGNNMNNVGVYFGSFVVPNNESFTMDTFLDSNGWFKGLALINSYNLGRYWPIVGPQRTLYVPKTVLNPYPEKNWIVLLELENAPCSNSFQSSCSVKLVDTPVINSTTPYDQENRLLNLRNN